MSDSNLPGSRRRPFTRRTTRNVMAVAIAVAGIAAAGVVGWLLGRGRAQSVLPDYGRVPDYRLTDQLARPVQGRSFDGKVRVVTFLFPYCTSYCPLIAEHLVGFERTLRTAGLQNRVQLVAFNVAPATTGPKQMRAFLKEYGWDPRDRHWEYLTGSPREIRRVVTGAYHIAYRRVSLAQEARNEAAERAAGTWVPEPQVANPLAQRAAPDYDVTHNDALAVVDTRGRIRKLYLEGDRVSDTQLLRVIRRLLNPNAPN